MNPDQPHTSSSSSRPRADAAVAPLFTHERSLSTKVGKGSDAHRIFAEQTQVLGTQLVTQLNILWKTARIHTHTNAAFAPILDGLLATIRSLAAGGALTIRLQNDFLYLDDTHLQMRRLQAPIFIEFIEQVSSRGIGALAFAPDLRTQDLREFAYAFTRCDGPASTTAAIRDEMAARGVKGIEVKEALCLSLQGQAPASSRQNVLKGLYTGAVGVVGDIMERIRHGRNPTFRQAKRIVQNLVDAILQDESSVLGLTTLRCYDEYTHNHSVNVCLLALALANRSGFPKPALVDLGVAALFHDIGKIAVPREVLNRPGELSPDEWELLQGHPVLGVLTLVRTRGLTEVPARMAAAAFEHHMYLDASGYPRLGESWEQSVTGRILAIADCYDGLTSSRVYRNRPVQPEQVLRMMLAKANQAFDPVLLKLFVNAIGRIPIGSLVLLNTGEFAVVLRPAGKPEDVLRPAVKIVTDGHGTAVEGPEIELSHTEHDGQYARHIVRLIDQTEHGFDTSRYFL